MDSAPLRFRDRNSLPLSGPYYRWEIFPPSMARSSTTSATFASRGREDFPR
jgi:hypothetical protein